jgi:GAF domain-containing protein
MDAVQYATDGPCVAAATSGDVHSVEDVLDEERWQTYARSAAAAHVRSSLSLPLMREGRLWGAINLYAADPDAFTDRLEKLQALQGVQLERAVTNADLEFRSRQRAEDAPQILRQDALVQQAIGFLMAQGRVTVESARARLHDAAARARIDVHEAAQAIIGGHDHDL